MGGLKVVSQRLNVSGKSGALLFLNTRGEAVSKVLTRLLGGVQVKASRNWILPAHLERKENLDPKLSMAGGAGKLREGGRKSNCQPLERKKRKALEKKGSVVGGSHF